MYLISFKRKNTVKEETEKGAEDFNFFKILYNVTFLIFFKYF